MNIIQQIQQKKGIKTILIPGLLIAGSFFFFFLVSILFPRVLGTWDLRIQDELFRLRYALYGSEEISSYIIHAAITDRTIVEENISLQDRDVYARLIRILQKAGASHIAYDIFFQDPVGDDNDKILIEATQSAGNIYYPVILYEHNVTQKDFAQADTITNSSGWPPWHMKVAGNGQPHEARIVLFPFDDLTKVSGGFGHINMIPEPDGIIRKVPLVYKYKDGYIPSLPLNMVCSFLNITPDNIEISFGRYILLKGALFPGNMKKNIRIPVDSKGMVRINFTGPWRDSFYEFSAEKLLNAEHDPKTQARLRDQIEGGMVLVSDISVRNKDKSTGIFDPIYPNSEIHSTIINMILTDRFVYKSHPVLSILICFILAAGLWVSALVFKDRGFYLTAIILVLLFVINTIVLFFFFRTLSPVAPYIPGFLFAFIGVSMYRFFLKEQESLYFRLKADAAENLNQLKNRFFRYISHDLKNPLMPIKGLLPSLLSDLNKEVAGNDKQSGTDEQTVTEGNKIKAGKTGTKDSKQTEIKDEKSHTTRDKILLMQRSVQKLENYIDELLDLVKIDAGVCTISFAKTDIIHFIEKIIGLFRIPAKKKNIKIDLHTEQKELFIWCDRRRMDKLVSNLLSNAIKFTAKLFATNNFTANNFANNGGNISISISAPLPYSDDLFPWKWEREKPGEVIRIKVKDTGKGIPEKDRAYVFEPFHQGSDILKGENTGAGIGLALVAEYIELHFGYIELKSEQGQGTECILYLPKGNTHLLVKEMHLSPDKNQYIISLKNSEIDTDQPENETEHEKEIPIPGEKTILVVDDDPEIRAYIRCLLEDNFCILEAGDGKSGYETAKKSKPDIILSDIVMPECGGIELVKHVKADPALAVIPIVLMTGNEIYEEKGESLSVLADEFIKKGFTKEELKKRINTVLKTKDQSESLERVSKRYLTKTRISPEKQALQKKQKLLPKHPILIIDDDTDLLQSYILSLGEHGINNLIIENDSRKVGAILTKNTDISLCILDLHMPHLSGIELMQLIIEEFPDIPVIITTGIKSIETAIYCIKKGAFDYLEKPVDIHGLVSTIRHCLKIRQLHKERNELMNSKPPESRGWNPFKKIKTSHPAMFRIFNWMTIVAQSDEHILILGESGVGKELLAEAIHLASKRTGKYVKMNIAGFDDTLFSDTLFGHKKGAFSGAVRDRDGLLKAAQNGTIFLDEIGDLDHKSQVKLLRLIESGEYYPLGSDKEEYISARIITATNANLKEKVEKGLFRKDLKNRLSVIVVEIPPLRDRLEDLPELLDLFFEQAAKKFKKKNPGYKPELISLLKQYYFPGNIRELKNMVTSAMSKHKGNKPLTLTYFKEYLKNQLNREIRPEDEINTEQFYFSGDFPTLEDMEGILTQAAVKRKKRLKDAAKLLGIDRFKLGRLTKKYKKI